MLCKSIPDYKSDKKTKDNEYIADPLEFAKQAGIPVLNIDNEKKLKK